MNRDTKSSITLCPACDARIHFSGKPKVGDVIVCHECDETLKVISVTPLRLDWSYIDDDESWSDLDYEEYDDDYDREEPYNWD